MLPTVTATATDDSVLKAGHTGTIAHTVMSADENYGGLTVASVSASTAGSENSPPTVSARIGNQTGTEDTPFTLDVTGNFSDADGDTLTCAATGLPEGLTIDPTTGIISGTLGAGGTSSVTVTATDGKGGAVDAGFEIEVAGANSPPTVANPIPDASATASTAFSFTLAASTFADVDSGRLSLSLLASEMSCPLVSCLLLSQVGRASIFF